MPFFNEEQLNAMCERAESLAVQNQALLGQNMQLVFIIAKIIKQYGDGERLLVLKEIEKILPKDTTFNLSIEEDDAENLLIGIECEGEPEWPEIDETARVM